MKKNIILGCIAIIVNIIAVVLDISFVNMMLANEYVTGSFWTQKGLCIAIVITSIFIGISLVLITYFVIQLVNNILKKA